VKMGEEERIKTIFPKEVIFFWSDVQYLHSLTSEVDFSWNFSSFRTKSPNRWGISLNPILPQKWISFFLRIWWWIFWRFFTKGHLFLPIYMTEHLPLSFLALFPNMLEILPLTLAMPQSIRMKFRRNFSSHFFKIGRGSTNSLSICQMNCFKNFLKILSRIELSLNEVTNILVSSKTSNFHLDLLFSRKMVPGYNGAYFM
jgi:hypothetical protein